MNNTCIIVADAGIARFFGVEPGTAPRSKVRLVELAVLTGNADLKTLGTSETGRMRTETNTNREAGPVHPIDAQRARHHVELERRFGQEITRQVAAIAGAWKEGTVVLVAAPRLLGLVRESLYKSLHHGIDLKELAKDYTHLTPAELYEHLALSGVLH